MTNLQTKTNKKIQIVDLVSNYRLIKEEITEAITQVLSSGQFVLGPNVISLESELSQYLKTKHVVSCANGTDAIVLALKALGIQPGDEVVTVSHSFFATSEAIALVGAKPVFVDILEPDFNINPKLIEKSITKKTKAIIPVHLYGQSCEIEELVNTAKKYGLYVIEDCAQAIGAKFNGKSVGTFGDLGTFSFFPTKNLGAYGDGGAVITNNEKFANKLKQLRIHGSSKREVHECLGYNSRLDEIQAAILRVKLKYLDKWNLQRQQAANYYTELLKNASGIATPSVKPNCNHVFHQYTIRTKNRDGLQEKLNDVGIGTRVYYPIPIHLQGAFKYLNYEKGSLPVTEKLCDEILSFPIYPEITKEDQEYVIENVRKIAA